MAKQKLILGPARLDSVGWYKRPWLGKNSHYLGVWHYEEGWHNIRIDYYSTMEEAMRAAEENLKTMYDIIIDDQEQFDKLQLLV